MIFLVLFLVFLSGLSFLHLFECNFSPSERIGFGGLLGMGFITTFMLLLNLVGLPITLQGVFIGLALMLIGFNIKLFKSPVKILASYRYRYQFRGVNFLFISAFCGIAFLFYAITVKNLYWTPISYDTIAGYDLMAKVVARDGFINNVSFG